MAKLNIEIISPEGVIFNKSCHMAVVPSKEGEIGFMYGHESVVASLQEGKISIYENQNDVSKTFDVKEGFAEIQDGSKLIILIDS